MPELNKYFLRTRNFSCNTFKSFVLLPAAATNGSPCHQTEKAWLYSKDSIIAIEPT